MLDLLVLLPLCMVGLLSMTFQVSVDEITDVNRKSFFSYGKYEEEYYQKVMNKVSNSEKCQCECHKKNGNAEEKLFNSPIDLRQICPHGSYLHPGYGRCILLNGEYSNPEARMRPPV